MTRWRFRFYREFVGIQPTHLAVVLMVVIAYRGLDAKLSVDEIDAATDVVAGILDGLPDYLVRQQQAKT